MHNGPENVPIKVSKPANGIDVPIPTYEFFKSIEAIEFELPVVKYAYFVRMNTANVNVVSFENIDRICASAASKGNINAL